MEHRPIVFIQLCLVLSPPSYSSYIWNLMSTFLSPRSVSRCYLSCRNCWPGDPWPRDPVPSLQHEIDGVGSMANPAPKLRPWWLHCKGRDCIAPHRKKLTSEALRHGSHSFYTANTPCLSLPRKRSPDGATTTSNSSHLIAACNSFINPKRMKGWVGLVSWWPTADGLSVVTQVRWRPGKVHWSETDVLPLSYTAIRKLYVAFDIYRSEWRALRLVSGARTRTSWLISRMSKKTTSERRWDWFFYRTTHCMQHGICYGSSVPVMGKS